MLNYIWSGIIIVSVLCSLLLGNGDLLSKAMIDSGASAVSLLMTMAGIMCLWTGIMKIASESGFTNLIAKLFSPLLRPLFPGLDKNGEAFRSITMNVTANLLGLGNTATPFGLRAMKELRRLGGESDTATDEMVIFVVMNTASLQLLPTTLGALRQSYGSSAPFEIIVPVWISSACALFVALTLACTLNAAGRKSRSIGGAGKCRL